MFSVPVSGLFARVKKILAQILIIIHDFVYNYTKRSRCRIAAATGRPVIMISAGYPVRSMSLPFPGAGYYLSVFFLPERGAGSLTF